MIFKFDLETAKAFNKLRPELSLKESARLAVMKAIAGTVYESGKVLVECSWPPDAYNDVYTGVYKVGVYMPAQDERPVVTQPALIKALKEGLAQHDKFVGTVVRAFDKDGTPVDYCAAEIGSALGAMVTMALKANGDLIVLAALPEILKRPYKPEPSDMGRTIELAVWIEV